MSVVVEGERGIEVVPIAQCVYYTHMHTTTHSYTHTHTVIGSRGDCEAGTPQARTQTNTHTCTHT